MEYKTGTVSGEYNYEDYEIKRKVLETILKKIKNGKATGEENILSETHKYRPDKLKTILFKILNEIYITGTTPAEWNSVIVMRITKQKIGKIQTTREG
jgi:hypothetical protein